LWIEELRPYDGEAGMAAARACIQNLQHPPSLAEYLAVVRSEHRRRRSGRPEMSAGPRRRCSLCDGTGRALLRKSITDKRMPNGVRMVDEGTCCTHPPEHQVEERETTPEEFAERMAELHAKLGVRAKADRSALSERGPRGCLRCGEMTAWADGLCAVCRQPAERRATLWSRIHLACKAAEADLSPATLAAFLGVDQAEVEACLQAHQSTNERKAS
jgi:hypothetical protein